MERAEALLVAVNRLLVALVLAGVFTIVFMNVVGRYGFGHSFAWVEEAARHLMILGAFAGAGLALREGRLVAITTLQDICPSAMARLIRWLAVLIMFVFMGVMLWLGVEFVQFGWNKETMSTGMPRGVAYLSIPIGCALFLLHLVLFAARFVREEFEVLGDADTGPDTRPAS
ncbi:TRAP transporter small permease [Arenibacterium halophilum]|uniref:TRAP transporter small permease protein n=1 Tax=Arenibacterium halophilum TaxID=2583821 RepID=A0ABY2XC44_9RHOB|nr:TRAP transporter small permease [Arenibacterium halophilum]TMV14605.1 TRAP transporter small permease [Arenibacterium halophilum]